MAKGFDLGARARTKLPASVYSQFPDCEILGVITKAPKTPSTLFNQISDRIVLCALGYSY